MGAASTLVRFAENETEALAAYRLRYEVFTLEEGDTRYARPEGIFVDELDLSGHLPVVAFDEHGMLVGTLRLQVRGTRPLRGEENSRFDLLAERLKLPLDVLLPQLATVTRGAVAKHARRCGVFHSMLRYAETCAAREGALWMIGEIADENETSRRLFERAGYQCFASGVVVGTWRGAGFYRRIAL